jgi:hypothetical protein
MPGNERFDNAKLLRGHQAATVRRITGERVVLAVQDTASLHYDTHEKTGGMIYRRQNEGRQYPQLYCCQS